MISMEKSFNFYANTLLVKSENSEILDILVKNFSYFQSNEQRVMQVKTTLSVELLLVKKIPYENIPDLVSSQQTRNAVVYDSGNIKYCDYYQEGLVILDKKANSAQIYCLELDFLHELSFLFIMSRIGKVMDLQGLHKVHACAFKKNNTSIVCMMPMKGGKSTIFLKMMKDLNIKYFSDDTPLVNSKGEVCPFPIRVGIKELPEYLKDKEDYVFTLERKEFGAKNLIEVDAFENKVAEVSSRNIVLIDSVRTTMKAGKIERISNLKMIFPLIKYMGIGLGLPIIIEFFLEKGVQGWATQLHILIKRLWAIMRLLLKAKSYRLYMGTDRDSNVSLVKSLCEN